MKNIQRNKIMKLINSLLFILLISMLLAPAIGLQPLMLAGCLSVFAGFIRLPSGVFAVSMIGSLDITESKEACSMAGCDSVIYITDVNNLKPNEFPVYGNADEHYLPKVPPLKEGAYWDYIRVAPEAVEYKLNTEGKPGASYFKPTLSFDFDKFDAETAAYMRKLISRQFVIIAGISSGEYVVIGSPKRPVTAKTEGTTGKKITDDCGFKITTEGGTTCKVAFLPSESVFPVDNAGTPDD